MVEISLKKTANYIINQKLNETCKIEDIFNSKSTKHQFILISIGTMNKIISTKKIIKKKEITFK